MTCRGARQRSLLAVLWKRFRERFARYFEHQDYRFSPHILPEHLFALGFQLRRAFEHTFFYIIGHSHATAGIIMKSPAK